LEFFGNSLGILWGFFGKCGLEFFGNSSGILSEFFGNSIRILREFYGNSIGILWGCVVGGSECVGVDFG
jgi:hypothetical protein